MADEGVVKHLLDRLNDPAITARSMFGGQGIYRNEQMFALVYDATVYMKVSEEEAARTTRRPFAPSAGRTFPSFREVPADVLEDRAALLALSEEAQRAAATATKATRRAR